MAAYRNLEREYIAFADRVITVSEPIAHELARANHLPRVPDLVLNAPVSAADERLDGPDVRSACGLADDVPLLVYSGGLAAPRGVHTVVEALPRLEGVHLAAVSRQRSSYTVRLERLAEQLGVADRLHLVPFVEPDQVMHYLSSATVGVIPLLHAVNHDWALTNKFFEYMHAGLPIVTSDVQVQTELVDSLGIGEAFVAGDPDDLVVAVRKVLANLDTYRARLQDPQLLDRYSWQAQGEVVLHQVYEDLLGPLPDTTGAYTRVEVTSLEESDPDADSAIAQGRTVLAIGPTNSAGQAWRWAKALERRYPRVETEVFWVERPTPFVYPADRVIPGEMWRSTEWQMQQQRYVKRHYTHVLLESGRGVLGLLNGGFFLQDTPELRPTASGTPCCSTARRCASPAAPRAGADLAVPRHLVGPGPEAAGGGRPDRPRPPAVRRPQVVTRRTSSTTSRAPSGCRAWSTWTSGRPATRSWSGSARSWCTSRRRRA